MFKKLRTSMVVLVDQYWTVIREGAEGNHVFMWVEVNVTHRHFVAQIIVHGHLISCKYYTNTDEWWYHH